MFKQNEITNVYLRLEELNVKINKNNEKLDLIVNILKEKVAKDCEKMGEHIDFIENVYEAVKNPLSYICNTINESTKLPEIKANIDDDIDIEIDNSNSNSNNNSNKNKNK